MGVLGLTLDSTHTLDLVGRTDREFGWGNLFPERPESAHELLKSGNLGGQVK